MAIVSIVSTPLYKFEAGGAVTVGETDVTSEFFLSSGISTQSTITMTGNNIWVITAVVGNIWIKFGLNPVAEAGDTWLIPAGQTREFSTGPGYKVAFIDA